MIGVDISEEAIAFANTYYSNNRLSFIIADMATLQFEDQFDFVVCLEGIEHVYKDAGIKMLYQFHKVLRDKGEIFLSCPIKETTPEKNPYHLHSYSYDEITRLVTKMYTLESEYISSVTSDVDVVYLHGIKK